MFSYCMRQVNCSIQLLLRSCVTETNSYNILQELLHDTAYLGHHIHTMAVTAWQKYTGVNYRENLKHRVNI